MPTRAQEVPSPQGIRTYAIDVDWRAVAARAETLNPFTPERSARKSGTRTTRVPGPDGIVMYDVTIDWDAVRRRIVADPT